METTEFDDWPLELGLHLTGAEARNVRAFIRSYRRCFSFSLQDLGGYKGKPIHIQLEDDHPIFGNLIGLVFPSGLVFRLVVESFGGKAN
jgi:hypothetical protein